MTVGWMVPGAGGRGPRLRARRVIPPNHLAGAATGCLSRASVCPLPCPASRASVAQLAASVTYRGDVMSFPARLLDEGEDVVVDVHPHWWYLAAPVAVAVISLAAALAAAVEGAPSVARGLVLAVLVLAFAWLVGRYLRWVTTSLVITTYRLVDRRGVLAKSGREIPLDHLSDISYRQSLFGRLIGEGDLLLESAGRNSKEVFSDLPRPAQIQNELYRQLNRRCARSSGGGSAAPSIPEQIGQLDDLRRRGVITATEFETKKAQLLDRL